MDDVDAELDERRIGRLLEYLKARTQTFVTTSKGDLIKGFAKDAKVFDVRGGAAANVLESKSERTIVTSFEGI